jgi:hypothetical protein
MGYGCGRVAETVGELMVSAAARVGLGEKLCGLMNKGEGGESNTSFGDDSREWTKDGSIVVVAAVWRWNCSLGIMILVAWFSHRCAAQTGACM